MQDEQTLPALGCEAADEIERLRALLAAMVEAIYISPADRARHDLSRFAEHRESCTRPRGDQACQCGMSAVRWNFESLLDEACGYGGIAVMDTARGYLGLVTRKGNI